MAQRILQADTREAEVETAAVAGSVLPALQVGEHQAKLGCVHSDIQLPSARARTATTLPPPGLRTPASAQTESIH